MACAVGTLFELCLDAVANNVCLVESFYGFPDLIGKQIFDRVDAANKFSLDVSADSRQALELFSVVYESDVLTSLTLQGQHLVLAECLDHLKLFRHLKALDLSDCGLGDDPELLYYISSLERLEVLILRNNSMSDEGIRKLTIPLRIKNKGSLAVQILDLSENEDISAKSLKFLQVFKKLQLLDLSACCSIVDSLPEVIKFGGSSNLSLVTAVTQQPYCDLMQMKEVRTVGWAAETVKSWVKWSQGRQEQRKPKSGLLGDSPKVCRFYGKRSILQVSPAKSPSPLKKRPKLDDTLCTDCFILLHPKLVPPGATVCEDVLFAHCPGQLRSVPETAGQHVRKLQFWASSSSSTSPLDVLDGVLQQDHTAAVSVNTKMGDISNSCSPGEGTEVSRSCSALQSVLEKSGLTVGSMDGQNAMCEEELNLLNQYGFVTG